MAPRLLLNSYLLTESAALNIMGGSNTLMNSSASKVLSSMLAPGIKWAMNPQKVPTKMQTFASGR
eukprot:scaffold244051_cov48-Attheya_sp.AAC.1